MYSIRVL